MNSDPATSQNSQPDSQWEVDRYLLSDPTFDRDAFEQRMLEDLPLALQVAAAVADLQVISAAARVAAVPAAIARSQIPLQNLPTAFGRFDRNRGTYRWAILTTAAVLLMAVSVWQFRNVRNDDQLSQIADNWVAFEGLSTAESLELIATDDQPNENQTDVETSEQSDWLVEAAREFYLAKNDGAAG